MLNITRALNNDRLLRALTGLNRKAFDELCMVFGPVYEESLSLQSASKPRKRARGGGRKARLESTQAKVFFILFYFKCYPTFDVLSIIFDLERGRSNLWVHRLQGIRIIWSERAFSDFKHRLRELTSRRWRVSMEYRIERLNLYVRGWMNYFGISQLYGPME